MIWFARASTSGGTVRPICFAVFRLITNSNLVGCSAGRSAGLALIQDYAARNGRIVENRDTVNNRRTLGISLL